MPRKKKTYEPETCIAGDEMDEVLENQEAEAGLTESEDDTPPEPPKRKRGRPRKTK